MLALKIDGSGKSSFHEIAEPVAGPGEVVVGVKHVGLCGSDLNTFSGLNPLVSLPRIPGHEIGAEIVIKATKVDGVYTADPKKDPSATRYQTITFDEALNKNLKVMDATAFALCREQKLNIVVFGIAKEGALKRVVVGEDEGTLVHY
mgnify:CR=1 FL=1